jgi:hypothetical protein
MNILNLRSNYNVDSATKNVRFVNKMKLYANNVNKILLGKIHLYVNVRKDILI